MCDLKAPFCNVPQWMGKTWATAGCGDGMQGLPMPAPALGLCRSHIPREKCTAPHPFLWFQGNILDEMCSSREQKHFTQGFLVGMTTLPAPLMFFAHFLCKQQQRLHLHRGPGGASGPLKQKEKFIAKQASPRTLQAPRRGLAPAQAGSGGTEQSHMRHAGAWGASLLSQASYCQQLNKLIGMIFPQRGRRFLI